jgi:hypothetical protein
MTNPEEVSAYKCNECGMLYDAEEDAELCCMDVIDDDEDEET